VTVPSRNHSATLCHTLPRGQK